MGPVERLPTTPREWKWSQAEKAAARRAYDLAVGRAVDSMIREAKDRAARIGSGSGLWDLESWLSERRREFDRTFDYRYSVLPYVFAALLHKGLLARDDLRGLAQNKIDAILRMASF